MSAGISLSTVASVVGIGAGLNSLMGGGGGGGGGSAAYDPYAKYRPEAAKQLSSLMAHPEQTLSQPGYQQTLQQGIGAQQAAGAAAGTLQSGRQEAALQNIGQSTFGSYYNSMLANLMQLSGATQSPASASLAAQQGAALQQQQQLGGLQTLMGGLGGLSRSGLFSGQTFSPNVSGAGGGLSQDFSANMQQYGM
jgi:hypothetical protein